MCINQRVIVNPHTHIKVLVPCGHCEACQQEKAYKRTRRIDLQGKYDVPDGQSCYYVTLTYDNQTVPYINDYDLEMFVSGELATLPIYRDARRYVARSKDLKNGKRTKVRKTVISDPVLLDFVDRSYLEDAIDKGVDNFNLPRIRTKNGYDEHKTGVIYYRDIQNFIKRLRINLKRKYNYADKIHFFVCAEYGPTTIRPHYHLLLYYKTGFDEAIKNSVVASWQYDNLTKHPEQLQKCFNGDGANYVSSYVNCSNTLPLFFQYFKPFRQTHQYSQGFGMAAKFTTLSNILEASEKRRFSYKRNVKKDGVVTQIAAPIPAYVINRYFPKFKGYSRIVCDGIFNIVQNPTILRNERYKEIEYTSEDIHKISVSIRNHFQRFCNELGLKFCDANLSYYAFHYATIWKRYYSFLNTFAYENIKSDEDLLYHFTNWYHKRYRHGLVRSVLNRYGKDTFEPNPNYFPVNLHKTEKLVEAHNNYDKIKKVKNYYLSEISNL